MIYIITLLVCVFCSLHFDVKNKTHNKELSYRLLLIWFIAVSGLQYMMGTDMESYMQWYQTLSLKNWSFQNLISSNKQYQPGWMALCYICRFISDDFVLLKLIQAIFVNISVFLFFKRETKYIFTTVSMYALMSYLVVNFNLMRQSFALGFALYAFTYLKMKDYKKYYFFVFLAYMFHNSAFILILLPLLTCFKFVKRYPYTLIILFLAIISVLASVNLENLLINVLQSNYLGESITELGTSYMSHSRLGVQEADFSIFSIHRLLIIAVVVYYISKYKDGYNGILGFAYVLLLIVTSFLPILWRFRLYIDFSFYIILARVVVELSRKCQQKNKLFVYLTLFFVFSYFPFREYLAPVENSSYRNIDQYYPYHSILNKEHDKRKQYFFNTLTR